MAYEPFNVLKSSCVPLPIENVDTDQIIPARFLKATERKDFGNNLFRDWRYCQDGNEIKNFVLNDKKYNGKILVCGKNFGSGSSREHAAWAIYDYGFRCVISSFFADIFKNNCLNIGVLPVRVSEKFLKNLFEKIYEDPQTIITIDLSSQKIKIEGKNMESSFDINAHKKNNLLNGFDDIDYLLDMKKEIKDFAKNRPF